MVKAGKIIWKETVKANWNRASSVASNCSNIGHILSEAPRILPRGRDEECGLEQAKVNSARPPTLPHREMACSKEVRISKLPHCVIIQG